MEKHCPELDCSGSGKADDGASSPDRKKPLVRIRPQRGWFDGALAQELWSQRDLLFFLVWRDLVVRYKQTILGAAWAILQPLTAMLIFAFIFGRIASLPSDGLPYPVFSYCGLILWILFSQSFIQSANSMVAHERLVTKIYFPRLFVPLAPGISCTFDFAISCCFLVILLPYYGVGLSSNIWAAPIMVLLTLLCSMGAGIWFSAIYVKFRDLRYVVPFITQVWLFASPVVYPYSMIPEKWRILLGLNPMAGAIEGFRWALLGTETSPWPLVAMSAVTGLVILVLGVRYFQKSEEYFADLL